MAPGGAWRRHAPLAGPDDIHILSLGPEMTEMGMHKVVVVLHVYYERLWAQLAACIENIRAECKCDIIVTIPDKMEGNMAAVRADVLARFPGIKIMQVENRGFDIGPFFEALNVIKLEDYDFVVKLHTKRDIHGITNGWVNGFHLSGSRWRKSLLGFCSSREAFRSSIKCLEDNEKAGIVSCKEVIVSSGDYYEKIYPESTYRALKIADIDKGSFVAGTMFMIRANLLKPLQGKWTLNDFPYATHEGESKGKGDVLPYVLERLLGYIVCAQGFELMDFRRCRPFFAVVHFFAPKIAQVLRFMYHAIQRWGANDIGKVVNEEKAM